MSHRQKAPWYVYILLTDQATLYTGIATDLDRRLSEHRDMYEGKPQAKGAKYFRGREPLKFLYIENCEDRSIASKREWEIKRMSVQEKQKLIQSNKMTVL